MICSRLICQCIFHFWCMSHNRIINTEAVFLCLRMGLNEIWVTYPFLLVLKHLTMVQSHSSKSTSMDWKKPKWLVVVESEEDGVCRSDLKWLLISQRQVLIIFSPISTELQEKLSFLPWALFCCYWSCMSVLSPFRMARVSSCGEKWHWSNISSMNSVLRLFYHSNQ